MNDLASQYSMRPLFDGERLISRMWPKSGIVWVCAIYMAMFIIRPWEQLFPELGEMRFERIMVLGVAGLTGLATGIGFRFDRQTMAVIGMVLMICAGTTQAYDRELAMPEITELVGIFISFMVLAKVIKTPYQLMFAITSYVVTTSVYLLKCEYEYLFHDAYIVDMGITRLVGIDATFAHPNEVAATGLYALPFLALLWQSRHDFTQRWPKLWRSSFAYFIIVTILAVGVSVVLTGSRAGMIGIGLFGVLLALRTGGIAQKAKYLGTAMLIGLVLFAMLPEEKQQRLRSTWDKSVEEKNAEMAGAGESAEGRWHGFVAGIKMFTEYPVFGVGMGNFATYREKVMRDTALDAHNTVGELMGETGLTGLLGFILVVAIFFLNCRRTQVLAAQAPDSAHLRLLGGIATACRDGGILLVYKSLSAHNFQRYNWLWFAAFAMLALRFAEQEYRAYKADLAEWDAYDVDDDADVIDGEYEVAHA